MKFDKAVIRKIAVPALIVSLALFIAMGAASDEAEASKKGFVMFGLSQLYDGTDQIHGGVGELLAGNEQLVGGLDTLGAALDEDIAGNLQTMKNGIDGQILPGLSSILAGISDKVVPGLGDIRGGLTEKMSPGLGQMITAIEGQMIPGLATVGGGIAGQMAPGLTTMKGAIDGQMVPGLGDICAGLAGKIAPGLETMQAGVDGQMVPGLGEILKGINDDMVPGLNKVKEGIDGTMVPTLGKMSTSVADAVSGLDQMIAGIEGVTGVKPGLLDGLDGLSGGINSGMLPLLAPAPDPVVSPPTEETSIRNDIAVVKYLVANGLDPTAVLDGIGDKVDGLYGSITHMADLDDPADKPGVLQTIGMVRAGLKMEGVPGYDPLNQETWGVLEGLGQLRTEITKQSPDPLNNPDDVGLQQALQLIRYGLSMSAAPAHSEFDPGDPDTFGASEGLAAALHGLTRTKIVDPDTGDITQKSGVIEGLTEIRSGLAGQVSPGIGEMLEGINNQMVPGLTAIRGGLAGQVSPGIDGMLGGFDQMVPGLTAIGAGLKNQVVPGMKEMKDGMDDQMVPGLGEILAGFNKTEAATGESGIIEGLTKISHGLANPEFSPNPGGDPGVSDGLGLVVKGIRTDVLGGIDELKSGITEKIMPGLEKMGSGISDELQPGFTKVSWLLLAIWLVSLLIILVVGILIGRAGKAKATAGRSASV